MFNEVLVDSWLGEGKVVGECPLLLGLFYLFIHDFN